MDRMRWTTGLLAALALLLSAPNARAGWKVDRAQAIAEHVWNYNYGCDEGVRMVWADPTLAFPDLDMLSVPLAWTYPGRCVVYLNQPRETRWGIGFSELCAAILHEYGHLAGREHSTNPRSIMYPVIHSDRRCRGRGRAYLARHALL